MNEQHPKTVTNERVCERCGITYTLNRPRRDRHIVRCRDYRGMR